MPAPTVIAVLGGDSTRRAFDMLPKKIKGKIARPALRKGAKMIAAAVEAEAPKASGIMSETIHVRARKRRSRSSVGLVVMTGTREELGIPTTTKSGEERGYYPAAIQYGWTPGVNRRRLARRLKESGTDRGGISAAMIELGTKKVPANPFVSRAFEATAPAALQAIEQEFVRGLEAVTKVTDDAGVEMTDEELGLDGDLQ